MHRASLGQGRRSKVPSRGWRRVSGIRLRGDIVFVLANGDSHGGSDTKIGRWGIIGAAQEKKYMGVKTQKLGRCLPAGIAEVL